MAFVTYNSPPSLDSHWAKFTQRLDDLENANFTLAKENAVLRGSMADLEKQFDRLARQVNDTASKVKVMRDTNLLPAVTRALDSFDVLEQILLRCSRKQLFRLQSVNKIFLQTIDASWRLRSKMFTNASEVLLRNVEVPEAKRIWETLQLNPMFLEDWTRNDFASHISLTIFNSGLNKARYLVDTELTATFECRIVCSEQSHYALKQLKTSLGRTYMTRPAVPTTVWVAFLVPSLIKAEHERQRALRAPASVPPNVSAVVDIVPATLLEIYEVAEVLRRYFPRHVTGDPSDVAWEPFASPLAEHDDLLHRASALMRSRPEYAGWKVAQSRAHSLSDITDWL